MKAIIIDDEKHVRDVIRMLVKWEQFNIDEIWEAIDGQSALKLIKEHQPQIIFTDMIMPTMNGVELLEWIKANSPHSKTIVISGHDDFSLVRHTMKFGGIDYILKPIDATQLNETLEKAFLEWNKEEKERETNTNMNMEMNQIMPVYGDKLLSELVTDSRQYERILYRLKSYTGLSKSIQFGRVVVLSIDTMESSLKNKFAANQDLLFFALTNICNEFLRDQERGIAFRYWNSVHEIVILIWKNTDHAEDLLQKINNGMLATLHCRLDFGLGETHPFPTGLQNSYKEARMALRSRNLLQRHSWIHTRPSPSGPLTSFPKALDMEEKLTIAMRSGNSDQIHQIVESWFETVRKLNSITFEQLFYWWQEFQLIARRWAELYISGEDNPAPLQTDDDDFMQIVSLDERGILSLPQLQQEFTRNLIHLSKRVLLQQHQEFNVIYDIAKFIEKNYKEDISLQDIANHFYLSREYISRKFKLEFGINLSDYLSNIRMEKAKILLLNPHLRITQIAETVGYNDEKYFSKVFKKTTGLSPNEYRKQYTT
ncbi:MAG: putative response regulatory protein [Bacilli bacterium]|nr:putative response regulatory protein [Bacilli bacterium]